MCYVIDVIYDCGHDISCVLDYCLDSKQLTPCSGNKFVQLGEGFLFPHNDPCPFCRPKMLPIPPERGSYSPRFLRVLREVASTMVEAGLWNHYWNYRNNLIWFFDFVLPHNIVDRESDDEDSEEVYPMKIVMRKKIVECNLVEFRSPARMVFKVPRKAMDEDGKRHFGYAVDRVTAQDAAATAAAAAAPRP